MYNIMPPLPVPTSLIIGEIKTLLFRWLENTKEKMRVNTKYKDVLLVFCETQPSFNQIS